MKRNRIGVVTGIALACGLVAARRAPDTSQAQAQDACWIRGNAANLAKRPSALDSATVALDGGTVKVCYGRPQRRGRTIMGALVPYGEPWRMGANEATAIHVPFRASIAGVDVAPGWYSLYTIPEKTQWRIVVNGEARRWGIPINDTVRAKDVGTGVVPVEHPSTPVEVLTIALRRTSKSAAMLDVAWGEARVSIPVQRR